MSDWIPEGSVAYDVAFADADEVVGSDRAMVSDGSIPRLSTIDMPVLAPRSPKQCDGNEFTCKGFKAKGTNFCSGHLKGQAKTREASLAAAWAEVIDDEAIKAFLENR